MLDTTERSLTSRHQSLTAKPMMTYKINSQDGRNVNVTFTFEDGEVRTKDLDLQPYGTDAKDGLGRPIIVLKDPFDDIDTYFKEYMEAYARGKSAQSIPVLKKNKLVSPVAEISKRIALAEDLESKE